MLDVAFANWTSSLNERGFDEAFLALLRANGYFDVHFTHGPYEFGKDVIAKRQGEHGTEQVAFQSKAGDINGSDWDAMFAQLTELLDSVFTHPNFDANLPQVRHLVTTGRLKGKAVLSANGFAATAATRNVTFTVIDAESLVELLGGLPSSATAASPSPGLEAAIGKIVAGEVSLKDLEQVLALLMPADDGKERLVWRAFLDLTLCARALKAKNLPLHAVTALLHPFRLGAVLAHSDESFAREMIVAARRLYVEEGRKLLGPFLDNPGDAEVWAKLLGGSSISLPVSYPIGCLQVAEYLAIAAMFLAEDGQHDDAAKVVGILKTLCEKQPGACHPISDRAAASVQAVLATLVDFGEQASAEQYLVRTTKWLCDRYQDSEAGLASAYASPDEEVRTLLLPHVEGIDLPARRESALAVALLDFAHVFAPKIYPDIVNDISAVGIAPSSVHANDDPSAYFVKSRGGTTPLSNIRYPERAEAGLKHHQLQPGSRTPERAGGFSVSFALAAITRDRLFTDVLPRLRARGTRTQPGTQ